MSKALSKKILIFLVLLAAMLGALAYLMLRKPVLKGNATFPIAWDLPESFGPYEGDALWFCLNSQCARSVSESVLRDVGGTNDMRCLYCDGTNRLSRLSLGELMKLPAGTPVVRRLYSARNSPRINASIVFSGLERGSIHRPQICLVAQGFRLTDEYTYDAPLGGDRTLPMRVVEGDRTTTGPNGDVHIDHLVYAYWYFSAERETPSYARRLFWISLDNVFRDYRPRWAYASVSMTRPAGASPDYCMKVLDDFVPRLYPFIESVRREMKAAESLPDGVAPEHRWEGR